ncbi:MAG: NADPH-dependent FMN reductase [Bacteroidota bacterium]
MAFEVSLLYGSVRTDRKGIRVAYYLNKKLKERGFHVNFIDPVKYTLPLLDKMYKEYEDGQAPENMEKIAAMLRKSDGFLIVSGEYNHGIPPAMKNLLDHFQQEYFFKPSAIASYSAGQFGGVRNAVHLRAVLAELGMPAISTILPFGGVNELFDEEGNLLNVKLEKPTKRFLDEFEWYLEALKHQRVKGTPF